MDENIQTVETNQTSNPAAVNNQATTPISASTIPTPPEKPQQNRLPIVFILIILISLALIIYGYYVRQTSRHQTPAQPITQQTEMLTTPTTVASNSAQLNNQDQLLSPTQSPSQFLTVEYQAWQKMGELSVAAFPEADFAGNFVFHQIGSISSGTFTDSSLWLGEYVSDGPCKGGACQVPDYARFIKANNQLILMPHNSRVSFDNWSEFATKLQQEYQLSFSQDWQIAITDLQYYPTLTTSNGQTLNYANEFQAAIDANLLEPAAQSTQVNTLYSTKPEKRVNAIYYSDSDEQLSALGNLGVICPSPACFLSSSFFWARPDGTMIRYSYSPPFSKDSYNPSVAYNDSTYRYTTSTGCSGSPFDDLSVSTPDLFNPSELTPVGQIDNQYQLFQLPSNHPVITEFYEKYTQSVSDQIYGDMYDQEHPVALESFIGSQPLLFWQDAFKRWVRLANTKFLPPMACEPIIYLYPPSPAKVQVKLGSQISLGASTPDYSQGWQVFAQPSGQLTNLLDNREYKYLFWEGQSKLLPPLNQGFIIPAHQIATFLATSTRQLGLIDHEIEDFLAAWLPAFTDAPYYKISFYDTAVINQVYPLHVAPRPNTVIRILMDYQPLSQIISIPPQQLPQKPPTRTGFTLVEWGGLKR